MNWGELDALLLFDDLQAWATNIGTSINAMASNALINVLSSAGAITKIRTEHRSETTDELIQAAEYTFPSPKTGAGTVSKTLQTSVVISLLTGRPGRSYRGRCYWPAWAYSGTATALFGGTDLTNWLAGFKAITNAIVAAAVVVDPSFDMRLIVRSRLLHHSQDVTSLGAGNVPDVQRRRRDAVNELYSTLAF